MKRLLFLAVLLLVGLVPLSAGAQTFSDVSPKASCYDAVEYVTSKGLMDGVGNGRFDPDGIFSRAMFVTMLGRLDGNVSAMNSEASPFSDIPSASWYAPYVQWASGQGIVKGTSPTAFSPNAPITREQYCAILCRYLNAREISLPGSPFAVYLPWDEADIQDYAKDSVRCLLQYGLVSCDGDLNFCPDAPLTRGEIADLFTRLHKALATGTLTDPFAYRTQTVQTPEQVVQAVKETGSFTSDWFIQSGWADPNDTVKKDGTLYGRVACVGSMLDVAKLTAFHYASDAATSLVADTDSYQEGESLYLPLVEADTLPGDHLTLSVSQSSDICYDILLLRWENGETLVSSPAHYFYDGTCWRFDAPLRAFLPSLSLTTVIQGEAGSPTVP